MTTSTLSAKKLLVAGVALSAALGLGACSSNDATASDSSSSSSSTQSARPEPIASLPAIPAGGSTAVALDADFVAALGTLGLTPATVGDATLADGSVSFPITGGHRDRVRQEQRLPPLRAGHAAAPEQRPEPDRGRHHRRADQLHRRPGHPGAALR